MRIAVIGGGISGLAAAHRISELLPDAQLALYEAGDRLGGVLHTIHRNGFLIERSADSFITKHPWASELCDRLGIAGDLLPTDEKKRRALVVCHGRLLPVPDGFVVMAPRRIWPIVSTQVLSWRGKLRLLAEPFVPRRRVVEHGSTLPADTADESVASFARRRLGVEAFERLVQPLMAGIYTADPEKLSVAATMPEYFAQEQFYGSLLKAARKIRQSIPAVDSPIDRSEGGESGARYGLFVAPREGVGQLVAAMAAKLRPGTVHLNSTAGDLRQKDDKRWRLALRDGDTQTFDAVIVALPTYAAATLFAGPDPVLAALLEEIPYAGCAVINLGYRREQLGRPLEGFGFVVPRIEQRPIIAASFASEKFPGRAPDDFVTIRVFVGGALRPELIDRPDDEICDLVHSQLAELLGMNGQPAWIDIARWPRSMPQYHVGHLQRVSQIEARVAVMPGLALAGNAYHGVGIPQCVRSGELAAERVAEWMENREPP